MEVKNCKYSILNINHFILNNIYCQIIDFLDSKAPFTNMD